MNDAMALPCFHVPGYAGPVERTTVAGLDLLWARPAPDDVRRAVDRLATRGADVLRAYTADDLARIFETAARTWTAPSSRRRRLATAMAALTGLGLEVVEASLAVEQGNCLAADIRIALDRDLGDRRALDGFVHDPGLGAPTRAMGPSLVGAILSSNVPGLSYLPIVRAFLVKSPLAAKLSSREPLFGPAFLESVAAVAPDLAECAALFCWPGGQGPELEAAMLESAPLLMVYGGPDTERHFRRAYGETRRIIAHGHKIGLAMIGRDALASPEAARDLAGRLALDVAMYGQQACISPQDLYVERGGAVDVPAFAEMVADALADLETTLPQGGLGLDTAAAVAQERCLARFEAAADPRARVFVRAGATVVLHAGLDFASSLPARFLRVFPLDDLTQVLPLIAPHGRYLQNAGLAVGADRRLALAEALAGCGLARVCAIGAMYRPSMRWKHDGIGPYAAMVRWTDLEMLGE
jgi:hypothetical protein